MPPASLTANQIVAYNLRRARERQGLTQEQAAERLEPYLGERWSKATFSAAERSVDGDRIREFTADDLVAFARAFGLPITYFLLPPDRTDVATLQIKSGRSKPLPAVEMYDLVLRADLEVIGRLREALKVLPSEAIGDEMQFIQNYASGVTIAAIRSRLDAVGQTAADLEGIARQLRESEELALEEFNQSLRALWTSYVTDEEGESP